MKILFFVLLLSVSPFLIQSQNHSAIDGNWDGFIEIQGQQLAISLIFNTVDSETDGAINIPQQASYDLPVEVPYFTADSLVFSFETGTGPAFFRASLNELSEGQISGLFEQSGMNFPFSIRKEKLDRESKLGEHTEQDLNIDTGSHNLAGSLVTPAAFEDSTLVIFASGSGSQTRNSPVAGFEVFKELAKELADRGYFSFRFDDRGTGGSTGDADATLTELAEDLKAIHRYFSENGHPNSFSSVVYLGHSQGGIVSLIAARDRSPRQLILLASPALPGDKVINQQIKMISKAQNIPDDVVEQNMEFQQRVYQAVRTGEGWEELEENIADRLREQIDELPETQRKTLGDMDQFIQSQVSRQLDGAKTRWFKSFIETDPGEYLKQTNTPVLALFGEKDSQVDADQNIAEIEPFSSPISTVVISRANHLFQTSETGMPGEYGMLEHKFTDGFIDQITQFLESYDTP